ncbi:methyl-accepting chemotaxis protein [Paenibacillus mesophilus]|uniref:methyl-accepting chemotaxis protein n=1 Tax=Paenibacillus mesophilus TaxID=2582849 RepID=UPI00110F0C81|nr:methyl-accepting chemotaxis protein [Paenibacillus mesophilus]TMV46451.1 methyl-accepting chemotaxis protein [Paenibacillus mesophilus]
MIGKKQAATRKFRLNWGWHRSIGFKLFAAFLASIVLTCAAAGWIAYRISSDALKQKVGDNMQQVVQDAANNTDRWYKVMEGTYNQLAVYADKNQFTTKDRRNLEPQQEPLASEYKRLIAQIKAFDDEIAQKTEQAGKVTESKDRIKITEDIARASQGKSAIMPRYNELNLPKSTLDGAINNYISAYALTNADMIYSIGLVRFNGENQLTSINGKAKTPDLYSLPWSEEALKGKGRNVYLPPQKGSYVMNDAETPVFAIAKSFWSPEDQKWADVLIVEYKLKFFEDLLRPINFGGMGDIHLIGNAGNSLFTNRQGIGFGDPAVVKPVESTSIVSDGGKGNQLVSSKLLSNIDWTIVGAIPEDKLLEDAKTIQNGLALLIVGGVVLALLLGWWGYRTIGRPLMLAVSKMRQAENGDLNVRLQMKRHDEIGSVGGSFDSMMERIGGIVAQTGQSADRLMQATVKINELVQRSRAASGEIAVAMNEVSSGADSLSRDAEKSTLLTGEMTNRLNDVIDVNRDMKEIAVQVEHSGRSGAAAIEELTKHNQAAEGVVSSLSERMERLQAGTESISVVLDIVGNISKQINILSLNASIVAASAGEAGKPFMVVAGEIRSLANQSKDSIASVEAVIANIQTEMTETSRLVADSLPIFQQQSDISRSSQEIFRHVESSMGPFMDSVQKVWTSLQFSVEAQSELSGMMMQVSAVSEESTATTENVASLVRDQHESGGELVRMGEELEQLAKELRQSLKVFQRD